MPTARTRIGVVAVLMTLSACTATPSRRASEATPSPPNQPSTVAPVSPSPTPQPAEPETVRFIRVEAVRVVDPRTTVIVVGRCVRRPSYESCRSQLVRSTDGGGSWRDITPPGSLDDARVSSVSFADPLHGWAVTGECDGGRGVLFRTADGGASWHASPSETSTCNAGAGVSADLVEPDVGFLIHAEPTASFIHLQRSANGGVTWSRTIELPEAGPLADVDFVDGEDGWLAGSAGRGRGVWRTLDAGRTWQRIRAPLPSACRHFDVRSFHVPSFFGDTGVLPLTCRSDRRWLIGFDVSRDGGRTWHVASATSIRMETRNGWPAFAVAGAGTWWTGAGGTVRITFDGGGSWRQVPTPPDTRVDTIAPVEGDSAWLVATRGRHTTLLFRTDDGGRSWRRVRPETATGRARPLGDLWYGRIPVAATCPSGPFAAGETEAELRAAARRFLRAADGPVPDARAVWQLMDRSLRTVFRDFETFERTFEGTTIAGGPMRWRLREMWQPRKNRLPGPYPAWLRATCTHQLLAELPGSGWAIGVSAGHRGEATLYFLERPHGFRFWAVR